MLDSLYENIGGKIKNWAKWIFIVEAIGAIITGFIYLIDWGFDDAWWSIFIIILGPIVAWVGSWILYAFGEMVEKTVANEANTKVIAQTLTNATSQKKHSDTPSNRTNNNTPSQQPINNLTPTNNTTEFVIQNNTLIKYNGNKAKVIVPENIEIIRSQSFFNNKSIESVTLQDGVTEICEWAFYKCPNLKKINIPHSVARIGANAFYGCDSLVIFAPKDSYAEKYAIENHHTAQQTSHINDSIESKIWKCTHCNRTNDALNAECWHCGNKRP